MSDSRGYRHPFNDCTQYLGGVGGKVPWVFKLYNLIFVVIQITLELWVSCKLFR